MLPGLIIFSTVWIGRGSFKIWNIPDLGRTSSKAIYKITGPSKSPATGESPSVLRMATPMWLIIGIIIEDTGHA